MFFNNKRNAYESFKDFFKESPLKKDEIWELLELMKAFYVARSYSGMLHCGGANFTKNSAEQTIKNETEYKRINTVVIPELMQKVYELLTD